MARPVGRRITTRKSALFPSELQRLLTHCPEAEVTDIARVSLLCRSIALGEYRIEGPHETDWQPPELEKAWGNREEGQLGRTPGTRTQRDLLFFPAEWEAFERRLPKGLSIQKFLRGLASGEYTLRPDPEGRRIQKERAQGERCALCGAPPWQDLGEYCPPCRGVYPKAKTKKREPNKRESKKRAA